MKLNMDNQRFSLFKTCSTCKLTFSTIRELLEHEKSHGKASLSKSVSSEAVADRSEKAAADGAETNDIWTCQICLAKLFGKYSLINHRKKWHGASLHDLNRAVGYKIIEKWLKRGKKFSFRCPLCPATFYDRAVADVHLQSHRGNKANFNGRKDDAAVQNFDSAQEGQGSSGGPDSVHGEDHHQILQSPGAQANQKANRGSKRKRFYCPFCSASFKNYNSMRGHRYRRHGSIRKLKLARGCDSNTETVLTPFDKVVSKRVHNSTALTFSSSSSSEMTVIEGILGSDLKANAAAPPSRNGKRRKRTVFSRPAASKKSYFSTEGSVFCKYCFGVFAQIQSLGDHCRHYHLSVEGQYNYFCFACTGRDRRNFLSEEELLAHFRSLHEELGDEIKWRKQKMLEIDSLKRKKKYDVALIRSILGYGGKSDLASKNGHESPAQSNGVSDCGTVETASCVSPEAPDSSFASEAQDCLPAIVRVKVEEPDDGTYSEGHDSGGSRSINVKKELFDDNE